LRPPAGNEAGMALRDASELRGAEHVRHYLETDGEYGRDLRRGSSTLLLKTTGRRSGEPGCRARAEAAMLERI